MHGVPALRTSRLLLRPLCLDDVPSIQSVFPRWEIVQHLSAAIPWPYPPDGALSFVRDVALPGMSAGTLWVWTLRPMEAPAEFMGIISLQETPDNNRGFWLSPQYQGRGFASEAAAAVTEYWFETLGRPLLRVPKAIANTASRRISQSSGMRVVETSSRDYVGGRLPSELWEITREEWRARGARPC
jgi:[ribosomal protein S5]-alanine N-acetyltransferase